MRCCLLVLICQAVCSLAEHSFFLNEVLQPTPAPGVGHLAVSFDPPFVSKLKQKSVTSVDVWSSSNLKDLDIFVNSKDPHIATVTNTPLVFEDFNETHFRSSFNVTGKFLGYSFIYLQAFSKISNTTESEISNPEEQSFNIPVSVIRIPRLIDQIFVVSVAVLVSLIYINFGCALDWQNVKATIKRPIGPTIGFISQFGFMPLISFLLGRLLFPGQTAMQLGLFFTGCSPGGGASNIWTVALEGNLDLSITMTTISTFTSFAMIPLWVFTLGKVIFEEGRLGVPYTKITTVAAGLLIPLIIGTLIQRFLPKLANLLVRLMKPFAVFLILFIVVFGTVANLYLFTLLNWKIMLGGLCVPWLGYMFGALFARVLRQSGKDIIAISVETGVQNTGISIYLLRFALEQPDADIAQVCPVAVSLMTPIPLALLSLGLRLWKCKHNRGVERLPSTELATPISEQATTCDKY